MTQRQREPQDHGATVDALEGEIVDVEAAAAGDGAQQGEDSAPVPGVPEPPD